MRAKKSICIDHHGTNRKFAKLNYVNPNAAAACEIMYKLLIELSKTQDCLSDEVGICLYSGIITDSGNFTNSNTTHITRQIAQDIEEQFNINASEIVQHFMFEITYNVFQLKNRVLSKAQFYEDNKIGIIYFSIEDFNATNTTMVDTEGIINNVKTAKLPAVVFELGVVAEGCLALDPEDLLPFEHHRFIEQ